MRFFISKNVYRILPPAQLVGAIRELGCRGPACAAWLQILSKQSRQGQWNVRVRQVA